MGTCCSRNDAVPRISRNIDPKRLSTDQSSVSEASMDTITNGHDIYDINEHDFGEFIVDKVEEKTAKRLMTHLKPSKGSNKMNIDQNVITAKQCKTILLFACILYLAYKAKIEEREEDSAEFDKIKLRKALQPSFNWMLENKLKQNGTLQKSEYKMLGKWLKEFYAQKQEQ